MSSSWQLVQAQRLASHANPETRLFSEREIARSIPDLYLWDPWPVLTESGELADVHGAQLWMALSAPSSIEPGARHDVARIRLLTRHTSDQQSVWQDHGHVLPDDATPGSREWAGCATYFGASGELELCYTVSGIRGEESPSFIQRIFSCSAKLRLQSGKICLNDWTDHREMIKPEGLYQSTLEQMTGAAGSIKAFRDPFRFVDPVGGRLYVLFTASMVASETDFDGVIGAASGPNLAELTLLPPLLTADGVNNELERPHIVVHDGLYYLFFSTQASTFHADVSAPTGLYGFVANRMDGEWKPLNDSGLVLRNPIAEPFQAYSWFVMQDLTVVSFVDFPKLAGAAPDTIESTAESRRYFSGCIAPLLNLALQGERTTLVENS